MKEQPLISIIISTHNRANYIKKAIKSVLGQTFQNFELIIVNDGSTDNTEEVLSDFGKRDLRIRQIINKSNFGLVRSLNKGISASRGKYIARIDDDDFWCDPKKIEKQIEFLQHNPDYVLVGGGVIRVDEGGKEIRRFMLPEKDEEIRRAFLQNNPFVHASVLFRKDAWEKAGGYDEALSKTNAEDWDLWMRFSEIGKYYNFQNYFLVYLEGVQNKTTESDVVLRNNALINIRLRVKYRKRFPGFWKAYLVGWAMFFYWALPFREKIHIPLSRLRRRFFGNPAYREHK